VRVEESVPWVWPERRQAKARNSERERNQESSLEACRESDVAGDGDLDRGGGEAAVLGTTGGGTGRGTASGTAGGSVIS
jgi:hypothetical protein